MKTTIHSQFVPHSHFATNDAPIILQPINKFIISLSLYQIGYFLLEFIIKVIAFGAFSNLSENEGHRIIV